MLITAFALCAPLFCDGGDPADLARLGTLKAEIAQALTGRPSFDCERMAIDLGGDVMVSALPFSENPSEGLYYLAGEDTDIAEPLLVAVLTACDGTHA